MPERGPEEFITPRSLAERFPRGVAVVDLDAIAANVGALLSMVGPATGLIAVVKANAYGHGAVPVAITALRAGADALAVACVDEGIQLRRAGIQAPILLLGATPADEMRRVVAHGLTPTVADQATAEAVQRAAISGGLTVTPVQVKIDTGLHRFGIAIDEAVDFVRWLVDQPRLRLSGLYTHFSSAEEEDGFSTAEEAGHFAAIVAALAADGIRPPLHAANTAATARYPHLHFDLVRTGLALYGLAGCAPTADRIPQHQALQLHCRIGRLLALRVGDAVGYGRTYIAGSERRAALVGIGYADGFRRALSNRGAVLINGHRAPVLGRVSMDQIVVDITDAGLVAVGDPVTVIGRQGASEISVDEIAALTDTIAYEIVTGLAPRVPRAYLSAGRLVGIHDLLGEHSTTSQGSDWLFHWPPTSTSAASD